MDLTIILIFIGLIFCGVICGLPIGYILGRRAMWREVDEFIAYEDEVLSFEVVQ